MNVGGLLERVIRGATAATVLAAWRSSRLNVHNLQGRPVACLSCNGTRSDHVYRVPFGVEPNTVAHAGFFDDDERRLVKLYGVSYRRFLPARAAAFVTRARLQIVLRSASFVDYRQCASCGVVFQDYPHTEASLQRFYGELYRKLDPTHSGDGIFGRDDATLIRAKELIGWYFVDRTGLRSPARVLDVGCAEGHTVNFFRKAGLEAHGIEPSTAMVRYAHKVLGLDLVEAGSYEPASYPAGHFDGIITHHVLEHVLDIDRFLMAVSLHLKPDGWFLVQVPCSEEVPHQRAFRQVYRHDHLYAFSEKFLRAALERHGLEVEEVRRTPYDLSELPPEDVSDVGTSAVFEIATSSWGDQQCGISVLARKPRIGR